jgi:hypothetical protein
MPCLFALFALLTPRVVIVLLWFFSHWFHGVFPTILWPVLGFIFLPTTLLWYVAVLHWFGGHWTLWPVVGLVIALLIDVSPASSRKRRWRRAN